MARFDRKSRYAKVRPHRATDEEGREILVVPAPPKPEQQSAGLHLRKEGERLDHLAAAYLDDPHGYWRICEHNDVMIPDALAEADEIAIPRRRG